MSANFEASGRHHAHRGGERADQIARCRSLWAAVLHQALDDIGAMQPRSAAEVGAWRSAADHALRWVVARDQGAGSFEWICVLLDLDIGRLRANIFAGNTTAAEAILRHKMEQILLNG